MLTSVHELEFCATGKKSYLTNGDIINARCVYKYNQNIGGIDNDRQLSITETVRKTMKLYGKLLFHLIDLCLSNAYALYKTRNEGAAPQPERQGDAQKSSTSKSERKEEL